jgi:hypothetical protein
MFKGEEKDKTFNMNRRCVMIEEQATSDAEERS